MDSKRSVQWGANNEIANEAACWTIRMNKNTAYIDYERFLMWFVRATFAWFPPQSNKRFQEHCGSKKSRRDRLKRFDLRSILRAIHRKFLLCRIFFICGIFPRLYTGNCYHSCSTWHMVPHIYLEYLLQYLYFVPAVWMLSCLFCLVKFDFFHCSNDFALFLLGKRFFFL